MVEFSPNMLPGCKGAAHFIDDLISFCGTYFELNKRKFGVIYVEILNLLELSITLAVKRCMQLSRTAMNCVIAKVVDYRATTAYVSIGQFAVATSYTSPMKLSCWQITSVKASMPSVKSMKSLVRFVLKRGSFIQRILA